MSLIRKFTFIFLVISTTAVEEEAINKQQFQQGKQHFEMYQKYTNKESPEYSKCYTEAVEWLHIGCKELTDEQQHRLAFKFFDCFREKLGRPLINCRKDESIQDCDKRLKESSEYSNFFTHTHNMCHFLKSQHWQKRIHQATSRLISSAQDIGFQLEDSSKKQKELLNMQERQINSGKEVKNLIETTKSGVIGLMKDFEEKASDQRNIMENIFDRISSFQNLFFTESSWLYSMVYYSATMFLSYLLTSTKKTSSSRFWIFSIFIMGLMMEYFLTHLSSMGVLTDAHVPEIFHKKINFLRGIFASTAIVVWVILAYRFQDIDKVNNQLLLKIQEQNEQLKFLLQNSKVPNGQISNGHHFVFDTPDQLKTKGFIEHFEEDNNDTIIEEEYEEDDGVGSSEEDDDEEDDSESLSEEDPTISFTSSSARSSVSRSRSSTPFSFIDQDEIKSLVESTPMRQLIKEAKNQKRWSSPLENCSNHKYNLRRRTSINYRDVLTKETDKEFTRRVHEAAKKSFENSEELRKRLK